MALLPLDCEMVLRCYECGASSAQDVRGTSGWHVRRARPRSMHLVDVCRECRASKKASGSPRSAVHRVMSNAAATNAILADTFTLIRAAGAPVTKRTVSEAYQAQHGRGLAFDWAFEQLESRGWIKRVHGTPGVDCVDGRYVATKAGSGR